MFHSKISFTGLNIVQVELFKSLSKTNYAFAIADLISETCEECVEECVSVQL